MCEGWLAGSKFGCEKVSIQAKIVNVVSIMADKITENISPPG